MRTHVPNINMFRNVLPFLNEEIKRYNLLKRFRFLVFRLLSICSFKNCNGIIFLSKWSKSFLLSKVGKIKGYSKVIPHGVYPKKKKLIAEKELDFKNKIKILYVSHTSPYKNYDYVIKNLILFVLIIAYILISYQSEIFVKVLITNIGQKKHHQI